ncbi:galactokinase [Micromonospora sp. NPDC003197]
MSVTLPEARDRGVVWAAPGRVNLIGEHTDYNDGYVLPFAIPQRCVVTATPLGQRRWVATSDQATETVSFDATDLTPGAPAGWGAYVAGVVWALREAGYDVPGARLTISSDLPVGAGLSSSAALACAVLGALVDLGQLPLAPTDWPRLAQQAENAYVGMPCGIMDQSAVTLCREGHALFLDCRTLASSHIPLDLAGAGLTLLVIDTRAPHRLVTGEYAARRAACAAAAAELGVPALRDVELDVVDRLGSETLRRRVRHVVSENERVLECVRRLRTGDVAGIGPLLTASHESLRDDYEVTVPELDVAVAAALAAGAYGARMTGGGFGGCVLALVGTDRADDVVAAVADAFATHGFAVPHVFSSTPARGVMRL